MSMTNGPNRPPTGCVSIPVEIIREPSSNNNNNNNNSNTSATRSRHNSPFPDDIGFGSFPSMTGRYPTRQQPNSLFDRPLNNIPFNQPFNDYRQFPQYQEPQYRQPPQRLYEPTTNNFSRSSEDLLSGPFEQMGFPAQPTFESFMPSQFGDGFRNHSDFLQSNRYPNSLRRSYDALNDFTDMNTVPNNRQYPNQFEQQQPYYRTTFETQHRPAPPPSQQQQQAFYSNQPQVNPNIIYTDVNGVPLDHYQQNTFQSPVNSNNFNDPSRPSNLQRGASPARPPPTVASQQQQQQQQQQAQQQQQQRQPQVPSEPELKMAKDAEGPIPMPPPTLSSTSTAQPTDQQTTSAENSSAAKTPSPPPSQQPARDPNTVALEKLEQIKQRLDELDKQVNAFNGSTRDDRLYKTLDEQALKIMIQCDELTDVSTDIREKRREMIRNVQKVVGKLESKVPGTPAIEQNSNPMEATVAPTDSASGDPSAKSNNNNNNNSVMTNQTNTEQRSAPSSQSLPEEVIISTTTSEQSVIA